MQPGGEMVYFGGFCGNKLVVLFWVFFLSPFVKGGAEMCEAIFHHRTI